MFNDTDAYQKKLILQAVFGEKDVAEFAEARKVTRMFSVGCLVVLARYASVVSVQQFLNVKRAVAGDLNIGVEVAWTRRRYLSPAEE